MTSFDEHGNPSVYFIDDVIEGTERLAEKTGGYLIDSIK